MGIWDEIPRPQASGSPLACAFRIRLKLLAACVTNARFGNDSRPADFMQNQKPDVRNHALDGVRAIAACLIVVFHLGLSKYATDLTNTRHQNFGSFLNGLGSSGVELFFTLSAVVLLRPYLRSGRPMATNQYLRRRIQRLWPPFVGAWVLAGATVALIGAFPTWWNSSMPSFAWTDWGSQLFIVYVGSRAYNFAWWTLTVEIIFYLLAPLLVVTLAKRSAKFVLVALVVTALVSQTAVLIDSTRPWLAIVSRFLAYASCFMGGVLLAKQDIGIRGRLGFGLLGLVIIGLHSVGSDANVHIGYGLLYMSLVSEALVVGSAVNRALSHPNLVWLGERSYSLFLTHYSVIALACWATAHVILSKGMLFYAVSRSIAIISAMVVACVLFELVESRFARALVTVGQWWPGRRHQGQRASGAPGHHP